MRFDGNAYAKLFPQQRETQPVVVETPVDTFTPTKDKFEEESVQNVEQPTELVDDEGGVEDGNNADDN